MKSIQNIFRTSVTACALLLICAIGSNAQNITGPTTPCVNVNTDYIFYNGTTYNPYVWNITNGTVQSYYANGNTYYVTVTWNSGAGTLSFKKQGVTYGSISVEASGGSASVPTGSFTYASSCYLHQYTETTTITRTNTPPGGTTWYWQTSETGTSTSIGSGASIVANAGETYYLRASSGSCWAPGALAAATIPQPPNYTPTGTTCYNQTIQLTASAPGGLAIRWYNGCTGGTLLGTGSTFTTPALTQSTAYFASAYDASTGAESPRKVVNAVVNAFIGAPTATSATSVSNYAFTANWTGTSAGLLDVATDVNFTAGSILGSYNGLSVTGSSQVVNGLNSGITHYYRIRATQTANGITCISSNSSTITAITPALPPVAQPPTAVTSTSFTANWDPSNGATSYLLDVAYDLAFNNYISGFHDLSLTGTSQAVTGLGSQASYYYRVRAVYAGGTTGYSNIVTTVQITGPDPNTVCMNALTNYTFSNGNSYTGYEWEIINGVIESFSSNGTTYTVTVYWTASPGTLKFTWHNGLVLASLSVTPLNPVPTGSFTYSGTCYLHSSNEVTVITRANSPPSGETWYWQTTETGESTTLGSGPTIEAQAGSSYFLRAYSSCWGSAIETATIPDPPDYTPGGISCYNKPVEIMASAPGGLPIRWYGTCEGGSLLGTGPIFTTPALTESTVYFASAFDATTGAESPRKMVHALISAPYGPATTTAATANSTYGFTANWTGASAAHLDVSTDLNFGTGTILLDYSDLYVTGTSKIVSGLSHGTTYYYRIRAKHIGSELTCLAGNSNVTSATTICLPPVALPGTLVMVNSFQANWIASFGAVSYLLDVATDIKFTDYVYHDLSVTGTNHSVTGLSPENTYYYRLRAVNAGGISGYSNIIMVSAYLDKNYIRTTTLLIEDIIDDEDIGDLGLTEKTIQTAFFDGLGRPTQRVGEKQSPAQTDMVEVSTFDAFGREATKYLPFAYGQDGWFKKDFRERESSEYALATNPQYQFYQNTSKVAVDEKPYSVTVFEPSPLNRVLEQGAPGANNQPGGGHTINKDYQLNGTSDAVLSWSFTAPNSTYPFGLVNAGTVANPTYYGANALTKNKTKDEESHEVIEYTDKLGRIVLKRVQATGTQIVNDINYASTYYIYDSYGNLVCVIPPEAVKRITQVSPESEYLGEVDDDKNKFLKRWAFRYTYDSRRRMTMKQVPGAEPVYMVYDNRDRLVMTQDGNQRAGATKYWSFTKYDGLSRPVLTGIMSSANTLDQAQAEVNTFYNTLNASKAWVETYVGDQASDVHGYDNKSYPQVTVQDSYVTVNYYDSYDFRNMWPAWQNSYLYVDYNLVDIPQPDSENLLVKGKVTGTKVKVLDGGVAGGITWLKSVTYYDEEYRVIQTVSDNYKGGQDLVTNVLDFTGKVLKTQTIHSEQDVTWKDISNVSFAGNKISRIASTGGAASVQMLGSGQNGWIEVTVAETNANRFFGFNDSNPDVNFASMEYCLYLNGTVLKIYESNVQKTYTGSQALATGDVLRIERTGSTIKYYRNGVALSYQNNSAVSSALLTDISLTSAGATLVNLRTSFSSTTQTVLRTFNYDHAGRLEKVYHKLNSDTEVLLLQNEYNEIGQLVDKKLHSTDGTTFKQSVDTRHNIRGWLTSINNSKLESNATTNDETNDLFGMELMYDQVDAGLGNIPLYNGNIGGIKWSNYPGAIGLKEKGYTFSYDPMNRLTGSTFKEKTTSWSALDYSGNAETGLSYDLNGNIQSLTRNDKRGQSGTMDILSYNYGETADAASNKLRKVDDTGDDFTGFLDGVNAGDDYTYDDNGNMITDMNKAMSTAIVYNFLNLPELVTRVNNTARYIYDATGCKLNQTLTTGTVSKQTDYAGEFQYENDALQFVGHEEGRIVTSGTTLVYKHAGEVTTGMTGSASTLTPVTQNGQMYVKVTANSAGANRGLSTIGSTLTVTAGERYRIRIKGYTAGANPAYINIVINGVTVQPWPGSQLPAGAEAEAWTEQDILIPTGGTTLLYTLRWYPTAAAGEIMYINEVEISRLSTATAEYQYFLKDHLGSVRMTFTAKPITTTSYTTDLEAASNSNFQNYTNTTFDLVDHTDAGSTYAKVQWLNGGINGRTGLAKSFSVMPGDEISVSAYCKYMNLSTTNNSNAFIMSLAAAFGVSSSSTGEQLRIYNGLNAYTGTVVNGDHTGDDENAPKLFATIVFFDRDYNFVDAAWDQVTTTGLQSSPTTKEPPHDLLSKTAKAPVAGYAFVFLSNEHQKFVDAYFDDVTISVTLSMVVQMEDYYPFGLSFNSYQRENATKQDYTYNGKELQDELGLGWLDYGARMYMADIARWGVIDPMADKLPNWSPYRYALNNPLKFTDIDGLIEWPLAGTSAVNKHDRADKGWGLVNTVVRTSTYGDTDRPPGASNPHIGIDYRASAGTSFYSLDDGRIVEISQTKKGAKYIVVEYGNGDKIRFLHISSVSKGLKVGDKVYEGQILGKTGKTGTMDAHLHVDGVNADGEEIDPEEAKYGTVTNEVFFNKYQGNYKKLREAKATGSNEPISKWREAKQDAIRMSNPWNIIADWMRVNPNIILNIKY